MFQRPTPEQELNRVIHHELGHWLMTRHFGFKAGDICVTRMSADDIRGSSHIEPYPNTRLTTASDIDEHIFKRIVVLCAGVAAEMEWKARAIKQPLNQAQATHAYQNGVMDRTGLNDKGKIDELLYVLIGLRNDPTDDDCLRDDQSYVIFKQAFDKAHEILNELFDRLFEMAKLMRLAYHHSSEYPFPLSLLCELELKAMAILDERKSLAVS